MLQKTRSRTIAKFKYLLMVPLMLAMLTYVACSEDNSTVNSMEEDSLSQYNYTLQKNEEMSNEKRKIHEKYEDFLSNNPGYVSWATIKGNEISYSVHRVDEKYPKDTSNLRLVISMICLLIYPQQPKMKTTFRKKSNML